MMKRARLWLGIAISIVCLALALKDVRFDDVAVALGGANYLWILVTALLTVLGMWARVLRWQLLFYPLQDLPFAKLFTVMNIGYLLSNILPARLGDLARAYLLGDLTGVSKARTLSTIIVERVADVLVILLFLAALLPFIPVPEWVTQSSVLLAAGFTGLAAMLVLMARHRQGAMSLLKRLAAYVPWLNREGLWHLMESLLDGLEILRFWQPALKLLVGSILIWLLSVGQFYAAMLAFDLKLPVSAAVFVLCVTALGMTVPSSPGYIGVWEYVIILGLSLFLVEKGLALSYALVLHATVYLTTTVMGVLSLWRESLALSILRQEVLPGGKS
jgi:uncharacterized protein (TIRG00374 family)